MSNVHLFVRPNLASLRLPRGELPALADVGRALDGQVCSASRDLSRALGADMASAKVTQVGRLPGSVNVKPGKGNPVALSHSYLQDMDEAFFLQLVPSPKLCVDAAGARVLPQAAAAQSFVTSPRRISPRHSGRLRASLGAVE